MMLGPALAHTKKETSREEVQSKQTCGDGGENKLTSCCRSCLSLPGRIVKCR